MNLDKNKNQPTNENGDMFSKEGMHPMEEDPSGNAPSPLPLATRLAIKCIRKKHNDERPILLYGVFRATPQDPRRAPRSLVPLPSQQPITVTSTIQEARDAVNHLVYINHYDHYKLWCMSRGLPVGIYEHSWSQYAQDCIFDSEETLSEEDDYRILEMYYPTSDIASMMRMFLHCNPIDIYYERQEEIINDILYHTDPDNKSHKVTLSKHLSKLRKIDEEVAKDINECAHIVKEALWPKDK